MAQAAREYIDFGIVLFVFGFGLVALATITFQAFCIIWSPVAAVICGLTAHKRGLNVLRYAIFGAVCSMLLFVPWLYVLRRMRNEQKETKMLSFNYDALYIMWGVWILSNLSVVIFYMFWLAGVDISPSEWSWTYFLHEYLFWLINGVIPVIGALALIKSRNNAAEMGVVDGDSKDICNTAHSKLPEFVHIMPFAYFSANIVAVPVVFLVSVYLVMPIIW